MGFLPSRELGKDSKTVIFLKLAPRGGGRGVCKGDALCGVWEGCASPIGERQAELREKRGVDARVIYEDILFVVRVGKDFYSEFCSLRNN